MQIRIKVVPGARTEGVEWLGDTLKVKVQAQPEKGRANAAVEALLAQRLALSTSSVRITAGFGSALKTVEISSVHDLQSLRQKLM
ncbi:MAG: hypothetical protein RLZZ227_1907 [Pseudomonadota bacterium]|jgi:uncharacterized protein YggU (UPF0235/DUF167 family)